MNKEAKTLNAPSMLDKAEKWGGDNKALLALLASGALGGTLGGVFSSRTPSEPDETPTQRRRRILMNVLGGTAAGAGVAGAGMLGARSLNEAVEKGGPGVVGGAVNYAKSLPGRAINAVAGGAGATRLVGGIQRKGLEGQLFSKDIPAEWQTPKGQGQIGLGRGRFTSESLDSAFKNPGTAIATPKGPTARAKAMQDAISEAMGHQSPEQTKAFVRGLGRTPEGESTLGAMFRRNLMPTGTPSTSLLRVGKAGINPRLLGGVGGAVGGAALPEIVGSVGSRLEKIINPTRDVNQPGT
jgi:hypothetical protein